ncbi:MAG: twin-arginine translocase TatA/TatE family subunit [Planctomycetes bacterium]|nr:twin-arginine translocase TatA/TatE family subunit [Planctomycetota bacterium]
MQAPLIDVLPELQLAFGVGPLELVVILLVVLLLFGGRLPNLMRNLGKSVVEFKKGLKDDGTPEAGRTELPDGTHAATRVEDRVHKNAP